MLKSPSIPLYQGGFKFYEDHSRKIVVLTNTRPGGAWEKCKHFMRV